ncbi:PAS domain S-box protein [Chitinimonas viridis]|uniref:histidine kinase n=1 Tax=Chitinimonas viridis TaxID=664880 RepID=A0ABT8B925_9NEIS|nr:PAS domain S-box protein [Chitinimonas viridis]MDN3578292.1 PAS domain S-box protein [Chitinimonas viridis]
MFKRSHDPARVELGALLRNAPTPLLLINACGTITNANELAATLCGYPLSELIGMRVEALVPERYRTAHSGFRHGYLQEPRTRRMGAGQELFLLRRDGRELPVEIGLGPLETGTAETHTTMVSLLDLSERLNAVTRMREAIEASPIAILICNEKGAIELVNREAESLFGYARSALIGSQIEMLLPEQLAANHGELRAKFNAQPTARLMGAGRELFARHSTGREIPVEVALAPLYEGETVLVQATVVDISMRRTQEAAMKHHTEELAAASRYKSEFLANMSHELRTPLNSILMLSEQLKLNRQGNLSEKQSTHAAIVHRSASDLLLLINDILDLAKIEAGRLQAQFEATSVREVLDRLRHEFQPQCQQKHLQLVTEIDLPPDFTIATDPRRLMQILRNLLGNALKFTDQGQIAIRACLATHQETGLSIAVCDTGIGISAELQDRVFDAFVQADGSSSRRYGGTGLGLAISKELATLLGGSLHLISHEQAGSTFTLWLPLDTKMPEFVPARAAVPLNTTPVQCMKGNAEVLLVEDDVRNTYAMLSTLEAAGYRVEVASNGQEALDVFTRMHPQAVLMDMSMPVMDGFEATRRLRSDVGYKGPILALTALAMPGDRERCIEAGCDDYLSKPISEADLLAALGRCSSGRQE